jgi:predicted transcriptional regulator
MRLTLDLSNEIDERLTSIASSNHISKAEVMRKAFALLAIADDEKKKGRSLGIISEDQNHQMQVIAKVIGF